MIKTLKCTEFGPALCLLVVVLCNRKDFLEIHHHLNILHMLLHAFIGEICLFVNLDRQAVVSEFIK